MKKISFLLVISLFLVLQEASAQSVNASEKSKSAGKEEMKSSTAVKVNGPSAKWDRTVIDFGEIPLNVPKSADFILTNEGNEPLLISSARASCGCTGLKYDKDPILPKKSVTISATYNAAAKGTFIKTVTVMTNASDQPVILQIKGTVVEM
jgi:hypothetical protein